MEMSVRTFALIDAPVSSVRLKPPPAREGCFQTTGEFGKAQQMAGFQTSRR